MVVRFHAYCFVIMGPIRCYGRRETLGRLKEKKVHCGKLNISDMQKDIR